MSDILQYLNHILHFLKITSSQHTFNSFQWSFIERVGKVLFQLAQIIILTRFLSKDDFGLVALALVSIEFSYLFVDAGLNAGILHLQNSSQRALSSVFWLNIGLAILLYGILWILSPLLADFYNEASLKTIIPLLGINILLLAIGRQHRTYLQRSFEFKSIALIEIIAYAIALILAIVLAFNDFGVYSLIYSTLLASLISNLSYFLLRISKDPITFEFSWKEVQPFIKIGKFQLGSRLLDFFSKESDILIIGKILGMEVLGLYSLTKQLVLRLFNVINPIITNVLSPWLASLQAEQKKQKNAYLTITRYLAYLNFPLYLIFTTGSFEILYLLYGPSYVSGTLLLFTLAIYYSILSITNPVGSLQIATGRTDLGFYWTLFRASITPIALLFGIQLNGVQGIAWVLLGLSVGLLYPLWWFQIRTMLPMSFRQYLEQFYRPLFSYLLLGFSVHFIVKPMFTLPNYVGTLIILLFVLFIQIGSIYIYDRTFFKTMQSYWQK